MRHRRPDEGGSVVGRTAALCAAATAMVVLTSCGISTDDSPRALSASTTTTTTTPPSTEGTEPAVLWFVQGERLIPVTRQLPDETDSAVLDSLAVAPTSDEGQGLSSSIPAGTEVLGTRLDGNLLTIDLSEEFGGVVGPARQEAVAQMVLSTTQRSPGRRLTFLIDGKPVKVTSPTRGDVDVVSDCDYLTLIAQSEASDTTLTEAQQALLELRRDDLEQRCPTSVASGSDPDDG